MDDLKDEAGTAATESTSDDKPKPPAGSRPPLQEVGPESEVRGGPEAPDDQLRVCLKTR
jgi:hypothetical protein